MFVLSDLEAPNNKTNSLCVQTHLPIKLFLILIELPHTNHPEHPSNDPEYFKNSITTIQNTQQLHSNILATT